MKKFLALLMVFVLMFAFGVCAFAQNDEFSSLSGTDFASSAALAKEGVDFAESDGDDAYVITVNSADGYAAAVLKLNERIAAGKTKYGSKPTVLKLNANLDFELNGKKTVITPINSMSSGNFYDFTFDGQGHTIKNYGIKNNERYYHGLIRRAVSSSFFNITIEDSYIYAPNGFGVSMLLGMGDGDILFDGITVNNCSLRGTDKIGPIFGFESGAGATNYFIDCHSSEIFIFGAGHMGGIAGLIKRNSTVVVYNTDVEEIYFGLNRDTNNYKIDVTVTCSEQTHAKNKYCLGSDAKLSGYYWLSSGYYWAACGGFWTTMGTSDHDCSATGTHLRISDNAEGENKQIANGEICVGELDDKHVSTFDEYYNGGYTDETKAFLEKYDSDIHNDDSFWLYIIGLESKKSMDNDLTLVEEVPADCIHTGVKAHYENSEGKLFDAETLSEVDEESLTIAVDTTRHAEDAETRTEGAVAPSCSEKGYTGDVFCADCGNLVQKGEVIPATGNHIPGEPSGVKKATCEEEGYTGDIFCTECGILLQKGEATPALGHADENDDGFCDRCKTDLEGYGGFRCKMCPKYFKFRNQPVVGPFYRIIHFFVHLAHYIGYLT